MSYTKLNQEIGRYLKANNLPWVGKSTDTKEQTELRLKVYVQARDIIFEKWLNEKKYKELISCAHGGWFSEDDFFIPLAKHFVKERELNCLKFLYEREVRYLVESMLKTVEYVSEDSPDVSPNDIITFDLDEYISSNQHNSVGEAGKWLKRTQKKIDRYITFLEEMNDYQYLELVKSIREKVYLLSVKKSDLKKLKTKL